MAEIVSISNAQDWYARIGNKKRIPIACWAVTREPGQLECNVVGMVPEKSTGLVCVENFPQFKGYEWGPFDRKERVDRDVALEWIRQNLGGDLPREEVDKAILAQKARMYLSALAEQELDEEWKDYTDDEEPV